MTTEHNRDLEREERLSVYELGFHFVPTLSEDDVTVKFSELKSFVEKLGGEFISEDAPKPINLAYDIAKTVKGQKKWYKNAYFGWIKFTLVSDEVAALEKEVKNFDSILRYLLITTVRENTVIGGLRDRNGRNNRAADSEEGDSTESANAPEGDVNLEEPATEAEADTSVAVEGEDLVALQ
ncbi:MAG: hypothetical protein RIQ72_215 [Candidatus Parcubacteria bacterium]|jgi:ribosomal protein S6